MIAAKVQGASVMHVVAGEVDDLTGEAVMECEATFFVTARFTAESLDQLAEVLFDPSVCKGCRTKVEARS